MNQIGGRFCVENFVGARVAQNRITLLIRRWHCTCGRLTLIAAMIWYDTRKLLSSE